jgi:diadenosine tetraphosphatase ApaH/serine/threonine PP2A family protein phosphatase
MLTALLSDIHGNREALTACLAHAAASGATRRLFLGDYVGYGADPGWVIDTVAAEVARGATAILGNHDAAIAAPDEQMNEIAAAAIAWTRPRLEARHRAFPRQLPLAVGQQGRLFVHANAWDPARWGYVTGPAAAARSMEATEARQIFCGHVHVPALYHRSASGRVSEFLPVEGVGIPLLPQRRWLAVIGAVGQPRDRNPAACYALLDEARDLLTYVRVPYDAASAARKVREAGLPPVLSLRLEQGY